MPPKRTREHLSRQVNEATSSAFAPEFLAKRSQNHLDELERSNYSLSASVNVDEHDDEPTTGKYSTKGPTKKKSTMNVRSALLYRKNLSALIEESGIASLPPSVPTYLTAVASPPKYPPRLICSDEQAIDAHLLMLYEVSKFLVLRANLSIPSVYAAPPTGDLRWRAPQTPADNSSVVQLANTQPLPCFQAPTGEASTNPLGALSKRASAPGSPTEDCLFLNVYFPGDTIPVEPLPTLVWIHGGGYIMGGADTFTGSDLMREANNEILLVIIQYRLGLFGFLAGSEVKEDGDLNAGLLDQDFALRWVQTHILQFGGDPSKVTIWGESAGAGSVLQHIVAQDGRTSPQLFRGAITSSTFLPSQYMFNDSVPELLYSEVVSQAQCTTANDSLACLRTVDAGTLGTINSDINAGGFFGTFLFVPVVDGTFITKRPTEVLKQGTVNGKALLSITNANEGTIFVNQTAPITNVSLYASTLFPKLGSQAEIAAQLYANLGTPLQQDDLVMGESIFICPTYYLLNSFPDSGWKGEFAVPPATHGADVVYYFTSQGTPGFNNTDFLAAFQAAFMSFVISQDPNDKLSPTITPSWNIYSQGNTEMIFNKTVDDQPDVNVNSTDNDLLERCNFWNTVGALTGQ
ncbi:cephalosporin esterase [Lentinula edodes]|uniref:Carboxylic ester hydrolase n=1 Tax=Lentinula edodes TaxID=5353 RepID=A0A1Q3EKQ2_LENED|nr:cephalosporin esterase [Lentinula edodes]